MPSFKGNGNAYSFAVRERAYRNAFLVLLVCFVMLCAYVINIQNTVTLQNASHPADPDTPPQLASRARMLEITTENTDFTYFPKADVLFMTMAKGGTTSTFNWLYYGMAGKKYNRTGCATYVQDVKSPCWVDHALNLFQLPEDDQWRILTGDKTLRVAIQRNPFERLVSSWKSKFTCDDDIYGTDLNNRVFMVPALLRQAGITDDPRQCLSITEFAETLDLIRTRVGTPATKLPSLRKLDVHIRPQEFYFEDVDYDMILDVKDLGNKTHLQPIMERLPHKDLKNVQWGPPSMHSSTGDDLLIPERAAKLLHLFAMESKWGKTKHLL